MSRGGFLGLFFLAPSLLSAHTGEIPGEKLGLFWGTPFLGMLLSLALLPLFKPRLWSNHSGKIAWGLALITLGSLWEVFGGDVTKKVFLETLFYDYLPFMIMVGALYTIGGGIQIAIKTPATPLTNTLFLILGTFLSGWIGTTGASMLLIRPFLHMNAHRRKRVHHSVFFIFLVANMGGALTPLGDPPLFLGFLKGVSFFWPCQNLSIDMAFVILPLLGIFYGLDTVLAKREGVSLALSWPHLTINGGQNSLFLLASIALAFISGETLFSGSLRIGEIDLSYSQLMRDGGFFLLAVLSYVTTPRSVYTANHFSWDPLKEVMKLFWGIFLTMIPVLAILKAGSHGEFAPLFRLLDPQSRVQNAFYFWFSGGLSSFLDNAPTYLVFFHIAGGNADVLMTSFPRTLAAISLGSVFMGAMTYIGNAPNFMIKAIADSENVPMPSFFGYMAWSFAILLPLFWILVSFRFL